MMQAARLVAKPLGGTSEAVKVPFFPLLAPHVLHVQHRQHYDRGSDFIGVSQTTKIFVGQTSGHLFAFLLIL
jgi:hypothetical protein